MIIIQQFINIKGYKMKREINLSEIINGTLLSDACIALDRRKYARYKLTAKDEKFLKWLKNKFAKFGIHSFITRDNKNSGTFSLSIYFNSSPLPQLAELRGKWYRKINEKTIKVVPRDLKLTSTTLLFW